MASKRHSPDSSEAQRNRQNAAFVVAGIAIALAAIGVGAAVTSPNAVWARPAFWVGAGLLAIGFYSVLAPFLALPFPSPRSEPIWRDAWSSLPVSRAGQLRIKEARRRDLRERLLNRLAGEAMRAGLTAHRAGQSLLDATLSPGPRNYWVALVAGSRYMLGFDASGNIVEVDGPDFDSPEVQARILLFEAIVAEARTWPEVKQLERIGP